MPTRARILLPALLAAIGLAIAGCSSNGYGSSGAKSGGGSGNATVAFASPANGAQVASPVKVSFKVQGTKIGRPETGDMHLHVYVDNSSNYSILYSSSGQVQVQGGEHTLKVVLAQPNHTETSTTATVKVNVTGGGQQAPTTTAGGGGYGYP
jgi:hypothetical protein